MTAAFILRQHIDLGIELGVRIDRTRLAQHLAALDVFARHAAHQRADVVAGHALIEQLAEHLDAGDDGLAGVLEADDLDFLANLDDAGLDTAGDNRAATRDREHVFHRHQERLVGRTRRLRDEFVNRLHQRIDRFLADGVVTAFKRGQRRTLDDRNFVAVVAIRAE